MAILIDSSSNPSPPNSLKTETILKNKSVNGSQGQRELYDIKDDELFDIVNDVAEVARDCANVNIVEINFYNNNTVSSSYKLEAPSTFEMLFDNA